MHAKSAVCNFRNDTRPSSCKTVMSSGADIKMSGLVVKMEAGCY